jgi:hypothetical protein
MLIKFRHVALSLLVLFSSIAVTGCGAGNPYASNGAAQDPAINSDGAEDPGIIDSGWTTSEGDDGSGYTATCSFSGDETDGDLVSCKVYWDAKNTSNVPLEYYGYTYLVVDGAVYQTSDGYADLKSVNPGSYAYKAGYNNFDIPYGGTITALYKAQEPNDTHLLDLSLNITISDPGRD